MSQPIDATFDQLRTRIHADAEAMGRAAADHAAAVLRAAVDRSGGARAALATGNSQLAFLRALRERDDVDWSRVELLHLDEYVGIPPDHPAGFRRFLHHHIVRHVDPKAFHGIRGDAPDPQAECDRYEALLRERPIDLCCMGIGENGHLAFNDPPFADFDDLRRVKVVELDEASRRQQVGEGHFGRLADVPARAITLTIPALLAARDVLVVVPEARKAAAVERALTGEIGERCPASVLRRTPHARLHLDRDSAARLPTREGGAGA